MPRNLRLLCLLAAGALFLTACPSTDEAGSPSSPTETTVPGQEALPGEPPTLPGSPPGAEALAELPGRLAVTDGPQLLLSDPSGARSEVIDETDFVGQPTWAPTGDAIAWTRSDGTSAEVGLRVIETSGEMTDGESPDKSDPSTSEGPAEPRPIPDSIDLGARPAIYLQWSADATQLGILQAVPEGIELSSSTVAQGDLVPRGLGSSLFFSWATIGERLALHTGSSVSVLPGVIDAPSLFDSERWFSAPAWLNESTLLVAGPTALERVDVDSGAVTSAVELAGPTEFVVNRPRTHVAFLQPGAGLLTVQAPNPGSGSTDPGALQVLDLESGEVSLVGLSDGQAVTPVAFEWSPDGSVLAFLAPSAIQPDLLRWYFWQLGPGGGHIVGATTGFVPSAVSATAYLPFFAQYAQSSTGWAPNSGAFALAGTIDGVSGVFVHVLGQTPQSIYVSPGDYVTWSPGNVQAGGRSIL